MCTVVKGVLPSLHGGSLKITLTVPLMVMRLPADTESYMSGLEKSRTRVSSILDTTILDIIASSTLDR